MRYKAERIVFIILIVIGILVSVSDFITSILNIDLNLFSQPIPSITLLILTTMTLFLVLELPQLERLDDIEKHLNKLNIEKVAQELLKERYAGIINVAASFNQKGFRDNLKRKNIARIRIMQSWIPNLNSFIQELEHALESGATVEVLLLKPRSQVASLRSAALDKDIESEIHGNLRQIANVYYRLPDDKKSNLRVKIHTELLSFALYQVDAVYYVSFFPQRKLSIDTLQLEVLGNNYGFSELLEDEFNNLWQDETKNPLLTFENQGWEIELDW